MATATLVGTNGGYKVYQQPDGRYVQIPAYQAMDGSLALKAINESTYAGQNPNMVVRSGQFTPITPTGGGITGGEYGTGSSNPFNATTAGTGTGANTGTPNQQITNESLGSNPGTQQAVAPSTAQDPLAGLPRMTLGDGNYGGPSSWGSSLGGGGAGGSSGGSAATSLGQTLSGINNSGGSGSSGNMSSTTALPSTSSTFTPSAALTLQSQLYPQVKQTIDAGAAQGRQDLQKGSGDAIDSLISNYAKADQSLAPYVAAGKQSVTAMSDLLGLNGAEAQQAQINTIQSSPSYQWQYQQGQQAVDRAAAALGQNASGTYLKNLVDYGQGQATKGIDQQYNRLSALSQQGLTATQQASTQRAGLGDKLAATQETLGQNLANNTNANTNATVVAAGANANNLTQLLGNTTAGTQVNTNNLSTSQQQALKNTLGSVLKF